MGYFNKKLKIVANKKATLEWLFYFYITVNFIVYLLYI